MHALLHLWNHCHTVFAFRILGWQCTTFFWNSLGFFICHDIKHGVCVQKQQKWYFIESTRAWCYYIWTGKFQKALQFAYSLWEINVARWQLVWQRRGLRLCGQTARLSLYKRLWCSVFSLVNTWRPLHVVISLTTTYIAALAVNWHDSPSCCSSLQQFNNMALPFVLLSL